MVCRVLVKLPCTIQLFPERSDEVESSVAVAGVDGIEKKSSKVTTLS